LVSVLLETLVTQSSGAVWLILLVEALALALVVGRVQLTGTPQGLRDETQGRPVSELRSLIERPAPGAVVEAGQNGPS
jgi:hypothetical protein